MHLGTAGSLVASLGFYVASDYAWIAAVSVVLYLCTAGVVPISEAALAHRVTVEGRVDIARYGRVRLWGSLGFIGAVTASGFVLQAAGPAAEALGALAVLRKPVVAWLFAGIFLTVLAHTALYVFYSLDLASLGYGKGAIGLFWAIGVAAEVAWFLFQGRWVHRFSMHV